MSANMLVFVVFLAVAAVFAGVALTASELSAARRRQMEQRLRIRRPGDVASGGGGRSSSVASAPETTAPEGDWFERLVVESGVGMAPAAALLTSVFMGLLLGGVLFLWKEGMALAVLGMLGGILLALGYLLWRRGRARRRIREQLPDAISLLARAVQAGESIEQAMQLVARHVGQPLSRHFQHCVMHLDMGLSVEASVRSMARRIAIVEAEILASTLIMQRRAGGNLAETLETLVRVIRDRLDFERHFRAATAAPRLSAYSLAIAGPVLALILWTWKPEYLEQFTTKPGGAVMLITAIALYLVGGLVIVRILRYDY